MRRAAARSHVITHSACPILAPRVIIACIHSPARAALLHLSKPHLHRCTAAHLRSRVRTTTHTQPTAPLQFARRKLFEKGGADDMPYCAMITGAQASGKSSVAAALARHPAMRTRYPHGAAWVHCGPGATPDSTLRHLLELVRAVQCASQAGTTPYLVDIAQCAPRRRPTATRPCLKALGLNTTT